VRRSRPRSIVLGSCGGWDWTSRAPRCFSDTCSILLHVIAGTLHVHDVCFCLEVECFENLSLFKKYFITPRSRKENKATLYHIYIPKCIARYNRAVRVRCVLCVFASTFGGFGCRAAAGWYLVGGGGPRTYRPHPTSCVAPAGGGRGQDHSCSMSLLLLSIVALPPPLLI